jgi:hypothetical protein
VEHILRMWHCSPLAKKRLLARVLRALVMSTIVGEASARLDLPPYLPSALVSDL